MRSTADSAPRTLLSFWRMLIACCVLIAAAACVKMDAEKSVTVIVSGVTNKIEQEEINKILESMYDKDARYKRYQVRILDSQMTVEMQPVADVEAFSRRINFGRVTEVAGRTIKVTYVKSGTTIQV